MHDSDDPITKSESNGDVNLTLSWALTGGPQETRICALTISSLFPVSDLACFITRHTKESQVITSDPVFRNVLIKHFYEIAPCMLIRLHKCDQSVCLIPTTGDTRD